MNINEAMSALFSAASALAEVQEVLHEVQFHAAEGGDPEVRLAEIRRQLARLGL